MAISSENLNGRERTGAVDREIDGPQPSSSTRRKQRRERRGGARAATCRRGAASARVQGGGGDSGRPAEAVTCAGEVQNAGGKRCFDHRRTAKTLSSWCHFCRRRGIRVSYRCEQEKRTEREGAAWPYGRGRPRTQPSMTGSASLARRQAAELQLL